MTFSNPFEEFLEAMAESMKRNAERTAPPPQLRGQQIGDTYYVRADDLAALLASKGLLPNLVLSLRKKATS